MSEGTGASLAEAVVRKFLTSHLSAIFIAAALCLGIAAVVVTPREEDPQIVVPMIDVYVSAPGCSAAEIEQLATMPLERIMWQIDGVEHVYSVSKRDMAVVTVRFFVGEDRERALTKLAAQIEMHRDIVPPIVKSWIVKPVEIDDVPIVTLALVSESLAPGELRRVAEEVKSRMDAIADLSKTTITGGLRREIRVTIDPAELRGRNLTIGDVTAALRAADAGVSAGHVDIAGTSFLVGARNGLAGVEDVRRIVVAARRGRPVYVEDVATVEDMPEESEQYARFSAGPANLYDNLAGIRGAPCVTLAFAKKRGTNAVDVANTVVAGIEKLERTVLPKGVAVVTTRNTGETADAKVDELLSALAFAVLTVVVVITFAMGWRAGLVVATAVPISFALALFVNYAAGFSINRVTLFALILSLGLVVDDPITNVDNIQRHLRRRKGGLIAATLAAVREVLSPVVMSTLAIIVSFLPMFFITGMMGPYMRPMAINVPLTVTFSTVCALTFVPWLALKLLGNDRGGSDSSKDAAAWIKKSYAFVVRPLLESRRAAALFFAAIIALLFFAGALVLTRAVPLKMLPFDNKNEFQVLVDLPEGATLEATEKAVADIEEALLGVPEVTDFQSYIGTYSPIDFNGLVRHYYFRTGPNLADIRVGIAARDRRKEQSHAIALRVRDRLTAAGAKNGATVKIVETSPGPPVIATITVEVYGDADRTYADLIAGARALRERLTRVAAVREIDDMSETPHERIDYVLDKEKAALHGVTNAEVARVLVNAVDGVRAAVVHDENERNPLYVRSRLARGDRSDVARLASLTVRGGGAAVELGSIGRFETVPADQPIYRKDLEPVVFVTAEPVGRAPAEAIFDAHAAIKKDPLPDGITLGWAGEGEWQITLRVFRDLGIAFGVALVGIYLLLVVQTDSFFMPLVIMTAIPLTAIGIMPGFWLLNLFVNREVGGYATPVFFTATAMIGMIALGGIVVRNSIVLLEFVEDSLRVGKDLKNAILESGAVRFRPIVLTALTTGLGAWPITLDPIFSGLAWALIFGLAASTAFTLLVVPTILYLLWRNRPQPGVADKNSTTIFQEEYQ